MGGGGGPDVQKISTLIRPQEKVAGELGRFYQREVGEGLPKYEGERYAPMTEEERAYWESFGELPGETAGLTRAGAMAYKEALAGAPAYEREMPDVEEYLEARETAARRRFEEETIPEIEEEYRGPGTYWGGVRSKATSRAREAFETELGARQAEQRMKIRESVAGRRLQTARQALGAEQKALLTAAQGEAAIRAAEQKGLDIEFREWLRTLPEKNPALKQALAFMGVPAAENIVEPGQEGGAAGEAIGSSAGMIIGSMVGGLPGAAAGAAAGGAIGGAV